MPVRLNGSTSGYTELSAPATAGSNTLTLPTGNGTADQTLVTNGSGTLSWADRGRLALSTAQNTTSGTSIDFTGIPSWARRITVMFNGVSTNGTSHIIVQVGAGSLNTSGYSSQSTYTGTLNVSGGTTSSSGFLVYSGNVANIHRGTLTIYLISSTTYISSHIIGLEQSSNVFSIQGGGVSPALSGTLDRIRITTVNGTDTFDAGSVNILCEG